MGLFNKLLGRKEQPKLDQCVLIHLDAVGLPDTVYEECDLSTLEDQLIAAMAANRAGELDGNEAGNEVTTIYTYGADAENLYRAMEPVLIGYPLCQNARVVIRKGGPGSPQREVQL
jgi:hypothetical protein